MRLEDDGSGPKRVLTSVTHGIRGTYRKGCRCDKCSAAEREYQQERKSKGFQPRNGMSLRSTVDDPVTGKKVSKVTRLPTAKSASATGPIGKAEQAVIEECAGLSIAQERPGTVEMARCLARIMDDSGQIGLWPTTSRQLQSMLNDLRGNSKRKSRGRLAKVANMTNQSGRAG